MLKLKSKMELQIYPFVEDGDLIIDSTLNGEELKPLSIKLSQLFTDFLEYRRAYNTSDIHPNHRQEVVETIALLRHIAREMEVEIDGLTN